MEKKNETEETLKEAAENSVDSLVLEFKKLYEFEGKTYEKIDLAGLEDINGIQMKEIEKKLRKNGVSPINSEFTSESCMLYAAYATGLPEEFFDFLPALETRKIKNMVINFFMS